MNPVEKIVMNRVSIKIYVILKKLKPFLCCLDFPKKGSTKTICCDSAYVINTFTLLETCLHLSFATRYLYRSTTQSRGSINEK